MGSSRVCSIAVVATLLAAGCAHSPPPLADACGLARSARSQHAMSVPFELVDGRIYVQASVNGRGPYRFAVDTGASGMGRADARLVAALGLKVSGQVSNSDGVRTASADTTRIEALDVGGLVRRDLEVITRDYGAGLAVEQRFDGIVGREFFGDGLLVIDYPNRTLMFSTTVGLPVDAAGSIGYERPFRVPVTIGGVRTTGHLDTGASVSAVLPMSLYQRIAATPLVSAGKGRLSNTAIETSRAIVAGPVEIGGAHLVNLDVRVSERFPELLIGAHVLQRYMLAIDQRSSRVALCPQAGQ